MIGLSILELTLVCQLHLDLKEKESKQRFIYSPPSRQEEKTIMQALHTSLRRIPQDGRKSEDDYDNEDLQQEEGDEDLNEDEKEVKPDPSWKPLLPGELKAWIGCLLAMGLEQKTKFQNIGIRHGNCQL